MLCDKNYFNKFLYTCNQLIINGKYNNDICLVIGDDLYNSDLLKNKIIIDNNINIKYFPDLKFPTQILEVFNDIDRNELWKKKIFQYHKIYLFDTYFKQWDYIFYIDCGMQIFDDIIPIISSRKKNRLLAHSDAYPIYQWKLNIQFSNKLKTIKNTYYDELIKTYNLNIDYFQTTIMLYDTNIINDNTFNNLYDLIIKYPISITNDQGIIALYFTNIENKFEQIKIKDENTYYYDYLSRNNNNRYIMLKMS